MKKRFLSLLLLGSVAITGCSSTTNVETESSITSIEESSSEVPTTTESSVEITETTTVETTTVTETTMDPTVYSLEGMSAEEIYAECEMIIDTVMSSPGKTVDEYYDSFKAASQDKDFPNFSFSRAPIDCICGISSRRGLILQSDDTVAFEETWDTPLWVWVTVNLSINDYEKATETYDLLSATYKVSKSTQEDDYWESYAENPQGPFCFLSMKKTGDAYDIEYTYLSI